MNTLSLKTSVISLGALLCVALTLALTKLDTAGAESQPRAKATAVVTRLHYLSTPAAGAGWTALMRNTLKTSEHKDIFVDVSLECGLYSKTLVRSKAGRKDASMSMAMIKVRVLVDGEPASPVDGVVFARRTQELSAVLQGLLEGADGESCLEVDLLTGDVTIDEACLLPEELELILDTMSANSFSFIYGDCEQGVHTIEVQARIETDASAQEGEADATATIGHGSVTVEEVRMIKGEDYEI